ncbi:MAG: hypothetical protein ACP5KG_11285, partial [Myxococcota bacterium]
KILKKELFTLARKKYTLNDFAQWLAANQKKVQKADLGMFLNDKYKEYEYSLGRKTLAFIYHNIALFRLKYFFFNFMPEMMFYKYILKD